MPGAMEWIPDYPDPNQHDWHDHQDMYNWAFMDGHVKFMRIRKGLFVTSKYTVIPFKELYQVAGKAQEPYE